MGCECNLAINRFPVFFYFIYRYSFIMKSKSDIIDYDFRIR